VPLMTLLCIGSWAVLLLVFGSPPALHDPLRGRQEDLKPSHYFFIGCSLLFMVGCAAEAHLKPWIGSCGNLGLLLTALSFGSGFLSKADFAALPWDVLMVLFGVNVMAFSLRESGLALNLANMLIPVQVYSVWLWVEVGKITGACLLFAALLGQNISATLAIPITVALGVKLYCPQLTSLLAVMAIHMGIFLPHSSTDMLLTTETSQGKDSRALLTRGDVFRGGLGVGVLGWLLVSSVAYGLGIALLGVPPRPIIIKEPTALIPSVVWLGNRTTVEEKVEILKRHLVGEAVNGTLRGAVKKESKLRPLGAAAGAPGPAQQAREAPPTLQWQSQGAAPRLFRVMRNKPPPRLLRGHHRRWIRRADRAELEGG